MTQRKSKKENGSIPNFRELFMNLPKVEQDKLTNYFNLHNAAIWVYLQMSEDAKKYCELCIKMTNEANKLEKKEEKKNV